MDGLASALREKTDPGPHCEIVGAEFLEALVAGPEFVNRLIVPIKKDGCSRRGAAAGNENHGAQSAANDLPVNIPEKLQRLRRKSVPPPRPGMETVKTEKGFFVRT